MESKKIIVNSNSGIVSGIKTVSELVAKTLGPRGKVVAIEQEGGYDDVIMSRDGATCAKSVKLSGDRGLGVNLIQKAALATESEVGDATSTTCVLTNEMISQGLRWTRDQAYNLNEIREGMEKAEKVLIDFIKNHAVQIEGDEEKVRNVATISSNNDPEVAEYIVQAMKSLGGFTEDATVVSEISKSLDKIQLEVRDGMRIEKGFSNLAFITDPKEGICELENPLILVVGQKIQTISQIQNFLEQYQKAGFLKRPLMIFAEECSDVVTGMLAWNSQAGALQSGLVTKVSFGEDAKNVSQDIATAVGATFVCPENNIRLEDCNIDVLGQAKKIVISKSETIIYGGDGKKDDINARVEILKARLADKSITEYEKHKFEKRIQSLIGGIAVLKVGGASEIEATNRKLTVDDAILCSHASIQEGILTGGGLSFLKMMPELDKYVKENSKTLTESEKIGIKIVHDSLPVIIKTIAENSGKSGEVVLDNVLRSKAENFGYNAKTGKYGDLVKDGVLDSARGIRMSITNAISCSSLVLLTDSCVLLDKKEDCCCCSKEK